MSFKFNRISKGNFTFNPFYIQNLNHFPQHILNFLTIYIYRTTMRTNKIFIAFTFINDLMSSKALASTESSLPWKNIWKSVYLKSIYRSKNK